MTAYADLLRKQKEQHTADAETRMNEAVEKYRKALREEAAKLNKGAQDSYQNFRPSSETSASASRGAYLNRMAAVNAAQNKASGALGAYGSYYSALYQGRSADTDAAITNIEKKDQEAQDAIAAYQQAVRKAKSRSYRKTTKKSSGETAQLTDGGQTTNNGSTTHVSSSGVTHRGSSGKLNLPTTGKNTAYQAKLSASSLSSKLKAGEITQAKTPSAKTATKTATVHGGSSGTIKSELATARSNLIKSLTLSALAGDSRTPDMVTAAVSAQTQYQKALDNQNQKIADAKKNLEAYKKPQRHPDTNTPFANQDDTAYNVKVIQNYLDAKAAWTDPNEIKLLTSNINNILSSDVYMTPEQRAGYMATVEELRRQEKDQVNAVDLWNQTAKAVKLDAGTASLLDTYNDAYDKRSYYNNYQDPGEAETEWNKSEATMAEIRDAFMREGYTEEQFKALAEMRRQKTNAEKQQARNELNAAYAEKYPILATLISTPASLISGSGLVDMGVDNALGYAETFAPNLDVNSEYFRMANFASTERQAVSKDMGKFAKFMYDVGTSGLDSLAAAAISSGLPGFGEFLLGSGAAVQEMMDVTSRGGTTQQAVTAGMAAGAFESIFEHVSIENLEALKEMPVRTAKDWVLNMLKSAVTNFEEEAATEVADIVSEYLIAGDVSEAAQTYEYYLSKGMSEQEASKQTAIDLAEQVLMAGASGAVMGIGFGAMSGVNAFRGQETTQTATLTPEQIMEAITEAFSGTQILNNVTEQIRDMDPSQASPILSEAADQMHAATEASIAEAERIIEERAAQQVSTDTVTVETLGEKTQTDRQAWTEEFNQSRRIGNKLNIDVNVNEGYRGTNTHGSIYFNDNNGRVVIEVAPDANSPMQVMKHELTHYIENSSYYDSISSYITDILSSQMAMEGRTLSDLEALIREDYRSAGYELDDKDVRHELIAKYVEENLFTSQSAVDALVEYDKPAARGILGWIRRMISRLKGEDVAVLTKAEKLFIKALNEPGNIDKIGAQLSAKKTSSSDYSDKYTIDRYDERSYNRYGWAYVNNIIPKGRAVAVFLDKIGQLRRGTWFPKAQNGDYIIPTGTRDGINNIFVLTDGDYLNPTIDTVIKVEYGNESDLDFIWRVIGNGESRETLTAYEAAGFINSYTNTDVKSYREVVQEQSIRGSGENVRTAEGLQERTGSGGKAETGRDNGVAGGEPAFSVAEGSENSVDPENKHSNSFGKSLSEYTSEVNTRTSGASGTNAGSIKTGQKEWVSDNLTREVISRASGTTPNGIKTDQSVLPKIDYNRALAEGTQRPYVNKNAYTLTQKARVALVDKDASLYDYRQKHQDSLIYEKKTLINSKATITAAAIGAQTGNRTTGMQLNAQMEPVGESLATIISDIKKDSSLNGRGMDLMQDYLYNKLNIERAATEKTFTGEAPTEAMRAADSERIVKNIETQYPAIKDHAAKVRKFLDNNLQFMVDTGTVSADLADKLKGMYPDYLPVMMNDEGSAEIDFSNYTDQLDKQLVKYAKGGNVNLMSWDKAIEKYTGAVYSQGFNNQMLNEIVAAAMNDPEWARHNVKILAVIPGGNAQTARQLVESNNSGGDNVYAAINGDSAVVFGVSDYLNSSVRTLAAKSNFQFDTNTDSNITNALGEVGNYFVKGGYMRDLNSLVTTYKPSFFLSNPMRDLGALLVNSPHLQETLASYPTAWAEVFSNSEGYQRFVAIMSNDILTPDTKTNAVSEKFTEISQATELVTRYAEYLGGIKTYGDTYEGRIKALYDAKEATVNFGRSGEAVQKANQYAFRFLNAGVQGIDKMIRNVTERKNTGALTLYTLRAAALGASPLILNALLWHDDDDFEQLTDSMKSKNLYLFKTNEGKFMGIPLGRTNSAISRAILYAADVLNGKENISYNGFTSMLQDVWDNVGIDVGSSFILSPIYDAIRNKTWYGGQIESDYEQDKPASERYDSSTDYLSRWIGRQTGWSPKKINYVLDQYGGVLFDYTFPLFTPETMGQNAYELAVEPVIKRFSADPVYSNDIGSDFNTAFRDSEQNRNSANPPAGSELVYKYMSAQKSAANKLYKEIDKINNFRDLPEEEQQALIDTYGDLKTYKDRKEVIRGLRITINGIKKNAAEQYDTVKAKAAEYSDYSDKEGYLRLNHDLFGAEYALKYYSTEDYAYAVTGAQGGMDYETYYDYMLNTTGISADKDKNGRSISGSKKQKYIDYISGLDISLGEKAFLLAREYPSLSNAYTPSLDSKKWKRALFDYVNSMDISSEAKKTILEQYDCFEVDSKGSVKIH